MVQTAPESDAANADGKTATVEKASEAADDDFDTFLELINSPTEEDPQQEENGSVQSTTHSDKSFQDYLNSPTKGQTNDQTTSNNESASVSATPEIEKKRSGCEAVGDKVDRSISGFFYNIGIFCSFRPKTTIAISLGIAILCAMGMTQLTTENRPEKLWVPQNTQAEAEQNQFLSYFPPNSRFQNVIASAKEPNANMLTKDHLVDVMKMHESIELGESVYENEKSTFTGLCTKAGGTCAQPIEPGDDDDDICDCLALSVLKMWNYDLAKLEADTDVMATLNNYGSREDLEGVLGLPVFDSTNQLVSAEAISVSYFLKDQSTVENGNTLDPVNEAWEEDVFLKTVQGDFADMNLAYLSSRSFNDEFGGEISGDLVYVQISYLVAFLFLGATLGTKICGRGSRWAMSMSTLVLIILATVAGFGIASLAGLLYGPVHSILPFVLLGIGLDDAFVIANAFDREREGVSRESEDDEAIVKRGGRALARAGASITVTSLTDLVAFAISSTSALPALASFCAFASINIFFLWALAATFFTSTMVIDEKRQRANRKDMLCCLTRKNVPAEEDTGSKEGPISIYFRKYHAPKILSKQGKLGVIACFAALFGFGVYGMINLPVEDSARNFIPQDSYINTYSQSADKYFPTSGTSLYITFESGTNIYDNREALANLDTRVSGLSNKPPYIAEPNSDSAYQNMMAGMKSFLASDGTNAILESMDITLGEDGWPATYPGFVQTVQMYTRGPGAKYATSTPFNDNTGDLEAYYVKLEYVRLTKEFRGETIDDASRQIDAMDATREMVEGWNDLQPAFTYSDKFLAIEGFKIIGNELYRNVGLAILCVGVIVLITVANFRAALLITLNVAFCIVEILGFMYALGIVIDSVSVINVVLAVGLSIDYSAHVGHCFMVKGGDSKDARATEALADIGASVLNGALSTFLAVAVLLFSTSYVFKTLAIQFALTVGLGVIHGLVLLPVLLSLFGPEPFASAEPPHKAESIEMAKNNAPEESSDPEVAAKDSAKDSFEENPNGEPKSEKTEGAESSGIPPETAEDKDA
eukprot:CAMPEP_0172304244 /NCGR_PEP_ID=MMETSP1058-20130122/5671_1 /TAXON_ID=83371 /ORGANISM="Detonula confervacea, Strain CCMP 353" /LENGTH=1046 /DNA_ID=CAMNT_0013015385 /DNA_START=38 /DNA_END=3178 /DNA_ORIENTATION=-